MQTQVFISLGKIAECSYWIMLFAQFHKKLDNSFQNRCTILHSHQQRLRAISLQPPQHLVMSLFFIFCFFIIILSVVDFTLGGFTFLQYYLLLFLPSLIFPGSNFSALWNQKGDVLKSVLCIKEMSQCVVVAISSFILC